MTTKDRVYSLVVIHTFLKGCHVLSDTIKIVPPLVLSQLLVRMSVPVVAVASLRVLASIRVSHVSVGAYQVLFSTMTNHRAPAIDESNIKESNDNINTIQRGTNQHYYGITSS